MCAWLQSIPETGKKKRGTALDLQDLTPTLHGRLIIATAAAVSGSGFSVAPPLTREDRCRSSLTYNFGFVNLSHCQDQLRPLSPMRGLRQPPTNDTVVVSPKWLDFC